jgi:hypothetical protein
MKCARCQDTGWVCERHDDRPMDHDGCPGAGMPCPSCNVSNEENPPRLPAGFQPDEDLDALIEANVRGWNGFWAWGDKPIAERGSARQILEQGGVHVVDLVSRDAGQDPPDCEAMLDGLFSGVEVTELVHHPTLERSLKAIKLRKAGKEAYFDWDRDALLSLIDAKDQPSKQRGRPLRALRACDPH